MRVRSKRTGLVYEVPDNVTPEVLDKGLKGYEDLLIKKQEQEVQRIAKEGITPQEAAAPIKQELQNLKEGDYLGALSLFSKAGVEGATSFLKNLAIKALPESIADEAVAFGKGLKAGATSLERGIADLFGLDVPKELDKITSENQLLQAGDEYSGSTFTGELTGLFLDPTGLAIGKLAVPGKLVENPVLRTALSTGVQGGAWGALGYTPFDDRAERAGMGALAGLAGGAAIAKGTQALEKLPEKLMEKTVNKAQKELVARIALGEQPSAAMKAVRAAYKIGKRPLRVPSRQDIAASKADWKTAAALLKTPQYRAQQEVYARVAFGEAQKDAVAAARAATGYKGPLRIPVNPEVAQRNYDKMLEAATPVLRSFTFADPKSGKLSDKLFWKLKRQISKIAYPFEDALADFSPKVFNAFRRSNNKAKLLEANLFQQHAPLDDWLQKAFPKLNKSLQKEVQDAFIDNTVPELLAKYSGTNKLKGLEKAWQQSSRAFATEAQIMKGLGTNLEVNSNYFPRAVKDFEGFTKALEDMLAKRGVPKERLAQALAKWEDKYQRAPGPDELEAIAWSLVQGKEFTPTRTFLQGRKFDKVPEELKPFYAGPRETLHTHLKQVSDEYADRMFLNLLGGKVKGSTKLELNKEILAKILSRSIPESSVNKAKEAAERYMKYIANRDAGMDRGLQIIKNGIYGLTIANPRATMTQLMDAGLGIYKHSLRDMTKAAARGILSKIFKNKSVVDLDRDFGLHQIGEEFVTRQGLDRRLLETGLNMAGFTKLDRAMKVANSEAAMTKVKRLLEKDPVAFYKKWEPYFGKDIRIAVQAVKNWKPGTEPHPFLKEIALNELLDIQPLTMAQMPLTYIANPNSRILYTLQTFLLRQTGFLRRDIYKEFQAGNIKAGMKKTFSYLAAMLAVGVPVSIAKDALVGKINDKKFSEHVANAFLNSVGLAKSILSGEQPTDWVADPREIITSYYKDIKDSPDYVKPIAWIPFFRPWIHEMAKENREWNKKHN